MFTGFLTAAVMLSLLWVALRAAAGQRVETVEQGMGVLLGCLVGGRLGYVWVSWAYYQLHPGEIYQFWLGGLSGMGAALGGVLALPLVAWATKQELARLADRLLPLLVVLNAAGWLGCWFEGCAYGLPAGGAWWGLPARDEWGQVSQRVPVQLLGALLGLAIPWWVEESLARRFPRSAPAGWQGALSLLGLALGWAGLSFLRGDPTLLWNGLRPETWGALALTGISVIALTWFVKRGKA